MSLNRVLTVIPALKAKGISVVNFKDLGRGAALADLCTLKLLMDDVGLRKQCSALMRAHDFRSGIENVLSLILTNFDKFERDRAR